MTVLVLYNSKFTDEPFNAFKNALEASDVECEIRPLEDDGVYAGIEAYLPTAIMIWITAQYFSPMIKELGKDHYNGFKNAFLSLYKKSEKVQRVLVGSKGKIKSDYPFSLVHSIEASVNEKMRLKLLLPKAPQGDEIECSVSIFLEFMHRLHSNDLTDVETHSLNSVRIIGNQIIVVANTKTGKLEFPDPIKDF